MLEEIRFELDCNTAIPHFHREMEFLYVLSGRIAILSSGCNYVLEPEDFIVLNPYEHHELYAEAGCHTVSGFLSPDIFEQAQLGRILCCSRAATEKKEYISLLRTKLAVLFKYQTHPSSSQKLYMLSQIFSMLSVLKTQFEVADRDEPLLYKDADRIQEVLSYIGTHYARELSMQEVADHVYLSKSHLSREFQRQLGISFSDYLRRLRLNRAAYLLRHTTKTITEIALSCGFSNTNTMILNFREEYRQTPGAYRKDQGDDSRPDPKTGAGNERLSSSHPNFYMNLLKYASAEEATRPLDKKQQQPVSVHCHLDKNLGRLSLCHNLIINVGMANGLLTQQTHRILQKVIQETGPRYIRFHGALDDDIDVYHEMPDGSPWLSFTYLDMIIDEILDLGLRPIFEFGYTPRRLVAQPKNTFGSSCINLPDTPLHLSKWEFLVDGVMKHFLDRYGQEELLRWKFSTINAVYVSYGVFSAEEYLEYYEKTFRRVRERLPGARFCAFGLDTGFLSMDGSSLLDQMLDYCAQHCCLPDCFTFQCFSSDYSLVPRNRTEYSLASSSDQMPREPARSSLDPDILGREAALCRSILDAHGLSDRPLCFFEWNSTIWQNDLGNDTCFKAAFITKNILENCGQIQSISFTSITDNSDRRINNSIPFHGGYGLFTYNGIPKAGYYALQLLTMLQEKKGIIAARGEGYLIARSDDRKRIQIMLYHYCHYNMDQHIDYVLSPKEQCTVDRYYSFEQKGTKSFHLHLDGLPEGMWQSRSFSVSREHGSSYDYWMHMGAPDLARQQEIEYLKNVSTFDVRYDTLHVTDSQELLLSAVLDEHEIRLLLIEKK